MKQTWISNKMVTLLISSALYTAGYCRDLIALEDDNDQALSVEFLEYLVDMECDSGSDCIELPVIQDPDHDKSGSKSQNMIDVWFDDEGRDEN